MMRYRQFLLDASCVVSIVGALAILILPGIDAAKEAPADRPEYFSFLTESPYPQIAWSILGFWGAILGSFVIADTISVMYSYIGRRWKRGNRE